MSDTVWHCDGAVTIGAGAGTSGDPCHIVDLMGPTPTLTVGQGDLIKLSNANTHYISGANQLNTPLAGASSSPITVTSTNSSWNPVGPASAAIIDAAGLNGGLNALTVDDSWWWFFNIDIRNGAARGIYVLGDGCRFIGLRVHDHGSDGIYNQNGGDRNFYAYTHSYANSQAGFNGNSAYHLPHYRCHFYGNGSVQCFQTSATITTGMQGILGCTIVGAASNAANILQGGLPVILDSTIVSSPNTAPSEALIKAYRHIIMLNSILSGRVSGITGLLGGVVGSDNDAYLGGNDWYNLTTADIGAYIRVIADHESPHTDIDPGFTSPPNDLTTSADLSATTIYQRIAAEADPWIKAGAVDGSGDGGVVSQLGIIETGIVR